jgi:molybdopterin synthase sulfur carrier subunit
MIKVRVLFFAALRDALGKAELGLSLPDGATLQDLTETIFPDPSDRAVKLKAVAYAINYESAELDVSLQQGDEVAFLPPMSGG